MTAVSRAYTVRWLSPPLRKLSVTALRKNSGDFPVWSPASPLALALLHCVVFPFALFQFHHVGFSSKFHLVVAAGVPQMGFPHGARAHLGQSVRAEGKDPFAQLFFHGNSCVPGGPILWVVCPTQEDAPVGGTRVVRVVLRMRVQKRWRGSRVGNAQRETSWIFVFLFEIFSGPLLDFARCRSPKFKIVYKSQKR